MKRTFNIGVILLLLMSTTLPAAEKTDKAARRAAILMQKMKQDLEAEKSALQTQFEEQKKIMAGQLDSSQATQRKHAEHLQGQLKRNQQLQTEQQKLMQSRNDLEQKVQTLNDALSTLQITNVELQRQLKASEQALAEQASLSQAAKVAAAGVDQQLAGCEEKNARLYQYGHELVSLYDDASTYTKVMRQETFFQLKRVELENILQAKGDVLDENRVNN